jgi:prepilin-type N-terminal cleavage/methylation domain-containing protein
VARASSETKSEAGFTLIEILVVVMLIGIVSAISYPFLRATMARYNFRAAARDTLNTTWQARSNSVRDNNSWQITINPPANSFNLVDPAGAVVRTINVANFGPGIRLIDVAETTCGAADKDWNNGNCNQAPAIAFSGRGFLSAPPSRSVFLEDTNSGACFAVTATVTGTIRLRRYGGSIPFAVGAWD